MWSHDEKFWKFDLRLFCRIFLLMTLMFVRAGYQSRAVAYLKSIGCDVRFGNDDFRVIDHVQNQFPAIKVQDCCIQLVR